MSIFRQLPQVWPVFAVAIVNREGSGMCMHNIGKGALVVSPSTLCKHRRCDLVFPLASSAVSPTSALLSAADLELITPFLLLCLDNITDLLLLVFFSR